MIGSPKTNVITRYEQACVIIVNQIVSSMILLVNKKQKNSQKNITYLLLHAFKNAPYKKKYCLSGILPIYLLHFAK